VFIVGSGRSGTSALACSLQALGMHVPQPEVAPDETNPKGFGESQWVVDFHDRLLRRANVRVADARPHAWLDTGRISTLEKPREESFAWLSAQFETGPDELVLKDPRMAWFLGLWRTAALRCGVEASYAVMLRPPTEVVGSKQTYYSAKVSAVSRAASWINHMLHTERATRGSRRAFVHYADLIDDWTIPLYGLGERFDLQAVKGATAKDLRRVHDFIDPDLRRVRTTWDDLDVPKSLQVLADETWSQLHELTRTDDEPAAVHAALDQIRLEYTGLYEEAEAMTESTALAARRKKPVPQAADEVAAEPALVSPPPPTAAAPEALNRRRRGLGRRPRE
jgi:hypothetical protein